MLTIIRDFLRELIEILFLEKEYKLKFRKKIIKYGFTILWAVILTILLILRVIALLFQQITTGMDRFAVFLNVMLVLLVVIFPMYKIIQWLISKLSSDLNFKYNVRNQLEYFCRANKFISVNYSPIIYYSFDNEYLIIRFRLDGSVISKKCTTLEEQLTNMFVLQLDKYEVKEGHALYKFRRKPLDPSRISIRDVEEIETDNLIKINENISWNFRKDPHGFINGGTGGGKTFFIIYLIRVLLEIGAKLKILDPKRSTLYSLRYFLGSDNVVCQHADIAKVLINTKDEMNKRYEEIEKKRFKDRKVDADYYDYGFKPVFIIFDELMAFMRGAIDKNVKKEAFDALVEIIAMGREAGFFVIIAMQRGSAKSIDVDVRDQLHFRCTLGKMGTEGYKMAFGNEYGDLKKTLQGKGTGFLQVEGSDLYSEPQEFYSPFIDKSYNFFDEVEKIAKEHYPEIYEKQMKLFEAEAKDANVEPEPQDASSDEVAAEEKKVSLDKENIFNDVELN